MNAFEAELDEEGLVCPTCGSEMYVTFYLVLHVEEPSLVALCPECDRPPDKDVITPDDPRA